jgi:hypothetical protein
MSKPVSIRRSTSMSLAVTRTEFGPVVCTRNAAANASNVPLRLAREVTLMAQFSLTIVSVVVPSEPLRDPRVERHVVDARRHARRGAVTGAELRAGPAHAQLASSDGAPR